MPRLRYIVNSIRAAMVPSSALMHNVLHRDARAFFPSWFCLWLPASLVLTLTACTPDPLVITRPVYIDRVQQVVQPIPAELLQPHAIAEGLPSECPSIAAQRRAELEACNADKAAIRAIAGEKGQGDE
jgi:hypothetical protein